MNTPRIFGPISRALLSALIVTIALTAAAPLPASAHARLTSSTPSPGSALGNMPAAIRMEFSESVDAGYSSAALLAADGSPVSVMAPVIAPDSDAGLVIAIPHAPTNARGVYTLVWRVLSATDGHITTGTLAFSVGSGAAPVSSTGAGESVRPPWWRIALRWLELATLTAAVGGFFFTVFIGKSESDARTRRVLTALCATLVVALVFGLHDQAAVIASHRFRDPPQLATYRHALFDTSNGRNWIVKALLCLVMLGCSRSILDKDRRRGAALVGLAAGSGALLTRSASGHAAGVDHAAIAVAVDWLHLASVSVWFGGLLFLVIALQGRQSADIVALLLARFSRVALAAVLALVATGLTSAAFHVAGPRSLRNSDYGLVLIAKHLLFAPALLAAGVNLLLIVPRLRRASDSAQIMALAASARRLIRVELAFAALVLIAAGALTELAPADGPLAVDVASRIVTINQSAAAGNLTVQVIGRLTGAPEDLYIVTVAGASGKTPAGLQRLIVVSADASDAAIGDRFDAQPLPGSPGAYFFPAVRIGLAAVWNLNVIVRRAGVDDVHGVLNVDVHAAAVQPPRLTSDHWRWPRLTVMSYLLAPLALALLVAGIIGVRRLPGLEPIAGGLILIMTVLIAAGFFVQAVRATIPVTAGSALANPIPNDPGAVARGSTLYAAYCLSCHGPAGGGVDAQHSEHAHGDSAGLLGARAAGATDGDLFWNIGYGGAGTAMPAYDHALTETERWDLVRYVRALQAAYGRIATPAIP